MKKDIADIKGPQTKCVHTPQEINRTSAITPPIWQTTTSRAESSAHFAALAKSVKPSEYYSRYGNPTHKQVEPVMATLEEGEAALVTASGMGAICTSVMSLFSQLNNLGSSFSDTIRCAVELYSMSSLRLSVNSRVGCGTLSE
jgi:O-acetylhomoserine/O-acetylserine sulfhydrylase-like pyridoxal-dependent enzyme